MINAMINCEVKSNIRKKRSNVEVEAVCVHASESEWDDVARYDVNTDVEAEKISNFSISAGFLFQQTLRMSVEG